jgi:hypothetical protein
VRKSLAYCSSETFYEDLDWYLFVFLGLTEIKHSYMAVQKGLLFYIYAQNSKRVQLLIHLT